MSRFSAVVIGASAGGYAALRSVLATLPPRFPVPILVVLHMGRPSGQHIARAIARACQLHVRCAEDKELPVPATVYFAPAGYHLLVEPDRSLSLSLDERVHHARPSIDVLFESAAEVYAQALVGVVLSGANADGSRGLRRVSELGGCTMVQSPTTAEFPTMPSSARAAVRPDFVLSPEEIGAQLAALCGVMRAE